MANNIIPPPPPGFVPDASTDASVDTQNISTQGAPAPALPSSVPPPPPGFVPDNSFQTPSGNTYTPGQQVQHSSGATGTITGQHPDTHQAMVQWNQNHPGQKYGVEGTLRANDPQTAGTAVARWAEQVSNDVKYGTDFTGIGKVLKKLGAHGVDVGNSEGVGDWMASIPLGILKATKGVAEVGGATTPGNTSAGGAWQGVKDIVGGAGQAATMPGAVIAPESSELENFAGQAVDHAGELASNAAKAGVNAGKNAANKVVAPVAKVARKVYPAEINPNEVTSARQAAETAQAAAERAGGPEALAQHPAMQTAERLRAAADAAQQAAQDASETAQGAADRAGGPEALAQHPATQDAEQLRIRAAAARDAADFEGAPERWRSSTEPLSPEEARAAAQPIFEQLHDTYQQVIKNAADDAGIKFDPGKSVQDTAHNAAGAFGDMADKHYAEVDNAIEAATGKPGKFQQHDLNLRKLTQKLRESIGDPEDQAKYTEAIAQENAAKAKTMQIIKDNGLEDVANKASALTKQKFALEDLGDKARQATYGLPDSLENPEHMNPKALATSLRNLHNNVDYGSDGRLTQAVGEEGNQTLKQAASDAQVKMRNLKEAATARMQNSRQLEQVAKDAATARSNAATKAATDLESQAAVSENAAKTQQSAKQTLAQTQANEFSAQAKDVPQKLRSQAQEAENAAKLVQQAKQFEAQGKAESLKDFADRIEKQAADVVAKRAQFRKNAIIRPLIGYGGLEGLHKIYNIFAGR